MVVRLVKMVFRRESVDSFKTYIAGKAPAIRRADGCEYLRMVQDRERPEIIFTYSHWRDEEALENYRNSELFQEVWAHTKAKFAKKASAWSLNSFIEEE